MALSSSSFEEFLAARQELLDDREHSISADSESPSSIALLKRKHALVGPKWIPCILATFFFAFLIGMSLFVGVSLIRLTGSYGCDNVVPRPQGGLVWEDNTFLNSLSRKLSFLFNGSRILSDITFLAQGVHVAGTRDNQYVMDHLAEQYRAMGFHVKMHNYSVLLNYPDFSHPNTIEVETADRDWSLISDGLSRPVDKDETTHVDRRAMVWWNAYSGNGTAEGRIVYANYGQREDFDKLEDLGISVRGSIVLVRFGGITRAEKVKEAERRGSVGVILFSDPIHFTSFDQNKTFPDDVWLPGTDAQRGTLLRTVGDPETPDMPSLNYVYREQAPSQLKKVMPRIPVLPIGYNDALRIIHALNGHPVQDTSWRGGLRTTYRYSGTRLFRLHVRSVNTRRTISNVVAMLKGSEEPDRWVVLGNHADAWTYGAVDPLSGTATLLEIARAFKELPQTKRTIVFCHWDAEEFGLIGSSEYVEEMSTVLGARAVAYLNIDHVAGNVTLDARGVPLLYRLIVDSAAKIAQTNSAELAAGRHTLLDSWRHYSSSAGPIRGDRSIPDVGMPTTGSDYQRFIGFVGVPSMDLRLDSGPLQSYPLYHTMYEVPKLMRMLDADGLALVAICQLIGESTMRLANSLIVPLNALDYANMLNTMLGKTHSFLQTTPFWQKYADEVHEAVVNLQNAINRLISTTRRIDILIADVSLGVRGITPVQAEMINSRLTQLERCFITTTALSSTLHRHTIFQPFSAPHGTFPLITMHFFGGQKIRKHDVLRAFSQIQYGVECAILTLDLDHADFE